MKVVKQVYIELYQDTKKFFSFVFDKISVITKWAVAILATLVALGYFVYLYGALGMSEELASVLSPLTVVAIVGVVTWVKLAHTRAKKKISDRRKDLLETIKGTNTPKFNADDYIKKVRKQP